MRHLWIVGFLLCSGTAAAECRTFSAHAATPATVIRVTDYTVLTYGDSKTATLGFQAQLMEIVRVCDPYRPRNLTITTPTGTGMLARGGLTLAQMKALVDADLAAMSGAVNLGFLLVNLGANDVAALPAEAGWIADALYVVDAFTVKYPQIKVYFMRPWVRNDGADCDTLAGWITTLPGLRSNIFLGPDERVFLENGDNGVTYTADGVHPNAAGYTLTAEQWAAVMGF